MLTSEVYSKEDRYVGNIDIPNLFIHTPIDRKPGEDKIIVKIKGIPVNILIQMDPGGNYSNVLF